MSALGQTQTSGPIQIAASSRAAAYVKKQKNCTYLELHHVNASKRHFAGDAWRACKIVGDILFDISVFGRYSVQWHNHIHAPERCLTRGVHHGAVRRGSYNDHCLDVSEKIMLKQEAKAKYRST
jgi:hypothetical protein